MSDNNDLGRRLREARAAAADGLGEAAVTQREVSRLAGLAGGTVHALENSSGNPDCRLETAKAIARVLGAKVGWLIAGEGVGPSRSEAAKAVRSARARRARAKLRQVPA